MSSRAGAIVISAKAQEWMNANDWDLTVRAVKNALREYAESQRFAAYTPEKLTELEAKYESLLAGIQAAKTTKENTTA